MIKVESKERAWELAAKLFPTDYAEDPESSRRAGYPIYYSTADGMNAWISDLGNTLELNYSDGDTVRINIETEQPKDVVAVVGMYTEKVIFGEVKIQEVKEIIYHHTAGLVNKTLDDGRFGIEITFTDGSIASFGCETVAYVRFE